MGPDGWQPLARPRFHTAPDLTAPTYAPGIRAISAALGRPVMPWQGDALDVIGQLSPDGTRMAWPYVVIVVPRRAGKSAAVLSTLLQRTATVARSRCWYTAQTRNDAALTFRDEWTPLVQLSPLSPRAIKLRQSNGSESLTWLPTRGVTSLFAPGPTALHGSDADAVAVDEAWAFTAEVGGALEAGIQPAQATRPLRQLLIVSAGGTEDSTWLDRWVQLGRDGTPGVALIEYAADPEHDDLEDPAVWARVHPAVGQTITTDTLASIRGVMDTAEFHRAFLGVWTHRDGAVPKLPPEAWRACQDDTVAPEGRTLAYGVETSHDGATTTLVAASVDARGRTVLLVVEQGPGIEWVPAAWRRLRARHRGRLYADQLGPSAGVVDLLVRNRLPVDLLTTTAYTAACAQLLADVTTGQLAHRGQPVLDAAALTATARPVGDRWVWERRNRDVAALVAATVAAHGARRPRATLAGATVSG